MKKRIEEHLNSGFGELTPDIWEKILEAGTVTEEKDSPIVNLTESSLVSEKKERKTGRIVCFTATFLAAACMLIVAGFGLFGSGKDPNAAGIIYIDSNAYSVAIEYDENQKVICIEGVDQEAELQADDNLEDSVKNVCDYIFRDEESGDDLYCIISCMQKKESDEANDEVKDQMESLVQDHMETSDILKEKNITVIYQAFAEEDAISKKAEQTGNSPGEIYLTEKMGEDSDYPVNDAEISQDDLEEMISQMDADEAGEKNIKVMKKTDSEEKEKENPAKQESTGNVTSDTVNEQKQTETTASDKKTKAISGANKKPKKKSSEVSAIETVTESALGSEVNSSADITNETADLKESNEDTAPKKKKEPSGAKKSEGKEKTIEPETEEHVDDSVNHQQSEEPVQDAMTPNEEDTGSEPGEDSE